MAGAISESEAAEAAALRLKQFRLDERKRDQAISASKERQEATLKSKLAERQKRRQEQHTVAQEEARKKADKALRKVSPPECTDQVTFVSAKVKDLTALWEALAANVVSNCMQVYIEVAQSVSSQYHGYVVTSSPESGPTLVAFQSAASAVHWCLSIQRTLLKADWPAELLRYPSGKELVLDSNQDLILFRGLHIQMGIDRGNVQMTKQGKNTVTYSGLAVHRSNALCNTAQGGQILVGAEAWKAATADSMTIGHQANNLGSIKLSGTENPIDVFEVYPEDIAARSKIFGLTCSGCSQPIKPGQEFLKVNIPTNTTIHQLQHFIFNIN
jgi:class 3 adenylate cyclase